MRRGTGKDRFGARRKDAIEREGWGLYALNNKKKKTLA